MLAIRSTGLSLLASLALISIAAAQSEYVLSAPELNRTSRATVSNRELRIIDQTGRQTVYDRETRFDSVDGAFLAYHSRAGGQIIRWPAINRGPMQIGTSTRLSVEYRTSQMRVMPRNAPAAQVGGIAVPGGGAALSLPGSDLLAQVWQQHQTQPQLMRLTTSDDRGRQWSLSRAGRDRLSLLSIGDLNQSDWYVIPAASGYVRVQQVTNGEWLALTASPARRIVLQSVAQEPGQLWRVVRSNAVAGGYWLESAVMAGVALTGTPAGVSLLPIGTSPGQLWLPLEPTAGARYEPLWRTVSHEVRANPALPAAQIDLVNSHSSPLAIIIADRRATDSRTVRIEPGAQVTVPFDRDAGGTVVETYEVRGPSGLWDRQQFVTAIPPSAIYDLSVYEEFLQSIAIDRTGTSPNPIEDINYQPKSVGWVPLPAGAALPDRGLLDPFALAKAANNPGAVRRFDPRSLEKPSTALDPLEAKLREVAPPPPPSPTPARQKF